MKFCCDQWMVVKLLFYYSELIKDYIWRKLNFEINYLSIVWSTKKLSRDLMNELLFIFHFIYLLYIFVYFSTGWIRQCANLFIAAHCILTLTVVINPLNQEAESFVKAPHRMFFFFFSLPLSLSFYFFFTS